MSADYTTIAVILFKSKTLSNGEHPLMLRITKNGVRKYKSLGISCKKSDWDAKANLPKKSYPNKGIIDSIIAKTIAKHKAKVLEFKEEEKDFTPAVLVSSTTKGLKKTTVFKYFEKRISDLKAAGQVGNGNVYQDTLNQLKTHGGSEDITFSQIDFELLTKLETNFRSAGQMDNSISIKFRTLRALFNLAILEGYARKDQYPFNEFKIAKRFDSKTAKRAIPKDEFQKVEAYKVEAGSMKFEAKMYFIFCYYGQGINFVDIANLKWKNIPIDRVYYKRSKSKSLINFALNKPNLAIIEYLRPLTYKTNESYVFPIIREDFHITATQKTNRIKKVLTRVNKDLKTIGAELKIQTPLTSYVARHTFANVLKDSGVATPVISEAMGHKTAAVTQTYFKSFPNSIIDEAMEKLM